MNLTLYYFTGTGNSRWIALQIAERLGSSAISIPDVIDQPSICTNADTVGIVFPNYLGALHGVPLIVERFLGTLEDAQSKRVFAICNCGGYEIVNAVPGLRRLDRFARSLGIRLAAHYTVRLPMNNLDYEHIPVPIETDSEAIFAHAEEQIADICERIERGRQGKNHLGRQLFVWALTPMFSAMGKATVKSLRGFAHEPDDSALTFRGLIPLTDKSITVDERCTGCGTCVKVCPVGNIALADGVPQWLHRCEMCFACDEFCPRGAIHHWGRPNGAKYHHPSVKAKDLFRTAATSNGVDIASK